MVRALVQASRLALPNVRSRPGQALAATLAWTEDQGTGQGSPGRGGPPGARSWIQETRASAATSPAAVPYIYWGIGFTDLKVLTARNGRKSRMS